MNCSFSDKRIKVKGRFNALICVLALLLVATLLWGNRADAEAESIGNVSSEQAVIKLPIDEGSRASAESTPYAMPHENEAIFDAYLLAHPEYKYATWLDVNQDGTDELLVSVSDNHLDRIYATLCSLSLDGQSLLTWRLYSHYSPITYDPEDRAVIANSGGTGVFERCIMQLEGDTLIVRHIGRKSPAYMPESYYYDATENVPGGADIPVKYHYGEQKNQQPDWDFLNKNAISEDEYDRLGSFYNSLEAIELLPIESLPTLGNYVWTEWSDWSTEKVESAPGREVDIRQEPVVTGYHMVHYGTQKESNPYYRMFRDYSIEGDYNGFHARVSYGEKHLTKYVTSEQMSSAKLTRYPPDGNFIKLECGGESYEGFQMGNTVAYNFGDDNKLWFVESKETEVLDEYTYYRYRDLVMEGEQ